MHFPNNNKYYGSWVRDKMQGYGVMCYNDGQQYYGNFEDGKRSGYGIFVYNDGSVYEGQWKNNVKNGQGDMKLPNGDVIRGQWNDNQIKNANYYKGTFDKTSIFSRFLLKEKAATSISKDLTFSHQSEFTVPEKQLVGDKWRGFFASFAKSIEDEKKRIQTSPAYLLFKERQGKGNVSPSTRINVLQTFKREIDENLESGLLSQFVLGFANTFEWQFHNTNPQNAKYVLPHALDDLFSFLNHMYRIVLTIIDEASTLFNGQGREIMYTLKNHVVNKIYKRLFELYKLCYNDKDNLFKLKLLTLSNVTMRELGTKEGFIPSGNNLFKDPYCDCIALLRSISNCTTPHEKFAMLLRVSNEINTAIDFNEQAKMANSSNKKYESDRGADSLLPVFLYVFIKSNVPHLYSEFQFMNDFNDERIQSGEEGYRFVNFELALTFVEMMDANIRDERGVLVTFSLLEERIKMVLENVIVRKKTTVKVSFLF